VADGKVYVGTRRGHFWVLAAGKQLQVLSSLKLPGGLPSTTTAANGMLYVATMTTLYAVQQGARTAPAAAQ
jgi:outer membrane protein assembly factor BamB